MDQTKSLHFQSFYRNTPSSLRETSSDVWDVKFGKALRSTTQLALEGSIAIHEIGNLGRPVFVELGLGQTGYQVAKIHLLAQKKFTAALVKLPGAAQEFHQRALQFCLENKVQFEVFDVDPFALLNEENAARDLIAAGTRSIMTLITAELCQRIHRQGGLLIVDSQMPHIEAAGGQLSLRLVESRFALNRILQVRQVVAVANFFFWSPNLLISTLAVPEMKTLKGGEAALQNSNFDGIVAGIISRLWGYQWHSPIAFIDEFEKQSPIPALDREITSNVLQFPVSQVFEWLCHKSPKLNGIYPGASEKSLPPAPEGGPT